MLKEWGESNQWIVPDETGRESGENKKWGNVLTI